MELENIVSFKAVNANGEETVVTVDEMTELVAGKINARTSEISTFASTASAGNDEFEDQLPVMSNANWVRGLDANGNPIRVLMKDLATVVGGLIDIQSVINTALEGIFIMFHRNSDNYPLMVKPHKWTSYQNSGEIAEGVVIVEGGKILVVAPTEATLYWSSAAVSAGGKTTSDRMTALDDWTGKASTAAQITHAECNTASYAPGFCSKYSRVNANGQGLTAGRWWLPSLGELIMIYANMQKINYALSLINGATQLAETWYWSSTESSETYAWYLYLDYGSANYYAKEANQFRVRAVSAFLR